jgi:hypothetical protein
MAKMNPINPPSSTKPVGKPGDERVRPEKSDYTKFDRGQHPHFKEGYSHVGKGGDKFKSEGAERVRPGKVDYTKFDRGQHPHANEGYSCAGKSCGKADGKERTEGAYKKKSPFRNA